ncbi:MAG: hypothetical protein LC689_12950 [Myxococcales bacterium]|nr:hypothetical protein [Myxococcales bacterium]
MMFLVTVCCLGLTRQAAAQWAAVTFHVVAHEDDWQLFFDPNTYGDAIGSTVKVVLIYVTAGDAGGGYGSWSNAREEGARRAIRYCADVYSPSTSGTFTSTNFNGHTISGYTYKNTRSYFLRLADGCPDGSGCGASNYESLLKFRTGAICSMTAVDGSTTYTSWDDLVTTIEVMVRAELANTGTTYTWFNIPSSSSTYNRDDHSDHTNTGYLMDYVAARMRCANVARFMGDYSATQPADLSDTDTEIERTVFAVTDSALTDSGFPSTQDEAHLAFIGRNDYVATGGDGSSCFNSGPPCSDSGLVECSGVCVDLSESPNCGYCGHSCLSNENCLPDGSGSYDCYCTGPNCN